MMKNLALALLLSGLMSLSDAGCVSGPIDSTMTHCQDKVDKTWHAVGSYWVNSRCEGCTCGGCCPVYPLHISFPDDCVSVFDWNACDYIVHKKNDPSVECEIYGKVVI